MTGEGLTIQGPSEADLLRVTHMYGSQGADNAYGAARSHLGLGEVDSQATQVIVEPVAEVAKEEQ